MQLNKDTTIGELLIKVADQTSIETVFSEEQVLDHVRGTYDIDTVFDEETIEKWIKCNRKYVGELLKWLLNTK